MNTMKDIQGQNYGPFREKLNARYRQAIEKLAEIYVVSDKLLKEDITSGGAKHMVAIADSMDKAYLKLEEICHTLSLRQSEINGIKV